MQNHLKKILRWIDWRDDNFSVFRVRQLLHYHDAPAPTKVQCRSLNQETNKECLALTRLTFKDSCDSGGHCIAPMLPLFFWTEGTGTLKSTTSAEKQCMLHLKNWTTGRHIGNAIWIHYTILKFLNQDIYRHPQKDAWVRIHHTRWLKCTREPTSSIINILHQWFTKKNYIDKTWRDRSCPNFELKHTFHENVRPLETSHPCWKQ